MKFFAATLLSLAFLSTAAPVASAVDAEPLRCATNWQAEACFYYDYYEQCYVASAETFYYAYYAGASVPGQTINLPRVSVGPFAVGGGSVYTVGYTTSVYLFSTPEFGRAVKVCETDGVVLA